MFQLSSEETYKDGDVIFEEGNSGDWVYIIDSGSVELYKKVEDEVIIVQTLQPGEIFGELAYFSRAPRALTAKAVGNTTVGVIDRNQLDKELNRLSGNFRLILKNLALRLNQTTVDVVKSKLRRKDSQRVPKILSLTFKSGKALVEAVTANVSGGGLFIKTSKSLPKGERFILKLQLPDGSDPIKIGAEVSWSRTKTDPDKIASPGMGVKFIQLSKADLKRLRAELRKTDPALNFP